jgi:hypothetical protein
MTSRDSEFILTLKKNSGNNFLQLQRELKPEKDLPAPNSLDQHPDTLDDKTTVGWQPSVLPNVNRLTFRKNLLKSALQKPEPLPESYLTQDRNLVEAAQTPIDSVSMKLSKPLEPYRFCE